VLRKLHARSRSNGQCRAIQIELEKRELYGNFYDEFSGHVMLSELDNRRRQGNCGRKLSRHTIV
jgi:hypothetical protein